jgi:hypothetical protein
MLRLRNAEVAIEQQVAVVEGVLKDVDGLRTRARLVGRDVKDTRKGVEEMRMVGGEMMQDVGARVELLEARVDDVEGLIGSVHEVVSKQLGLIQGVISEQKRLEKYGGKEKTEARGTDVKMGKQKGVHVAHASSADARSSLGSHQSTADEWGRQRISVTSEQPKKSPSVTNTKDGTVLYTFDS